MAVPLRVLLVEDSEDDALLLLRELRRGGYEPLSERVDTAGDMEAALEERGWDLVIADHSMPEFSSSAALELLRRKGFVDLPFIIVSGYIGENAAVAAMKAGAHLLHHEGQPGPPELRHRARAARCQGAPRTPAGGGGTQGIRDALQADDRAVPLEHPDLLSRRPDAARKPGMGEALGGDPRPDTGVQRAAGSPVGREGHTSLHQTGL